MASYPYPIRLDRKVEVTGSFDGTHTNFSLGFTDATLLVAILSDGFGANAGKQVTLISTGSGTARAVDADYSSIPVTIGRSYTMTAKLGRLYRRDQQGNADIDAYVTIHKVATTHHNTGAYTLTSTMTGRTTRNKSFSQSGNLATDDGELRAWFGGRAKDNVITITSSDARPCAIVSVQYEADYEPRRA